ncbi:hypothetical protein KCU81_g701, partial [Aureobasidium melanogenum]
MPHALLSRRQRVRDNIWNKIFGFAAKSTGETKYISHNPRPGVWTSSDSAGASSWSLLESMGAIGTATTPRQKQACGDTCDLEIEFLPVDALAFAATTVNGAVSQFFGLSRNAPLHQIMNVRKLVQRSRCSIVNDYFSVIYAGVLLVLQHQEVLSVIAQCSIIKMMLLVKNFHDTLTVVGAVEAA